MSRTKADPIFSATLKNMHWPYTYVREYIYIEIDSYNCMEMHEVKWEKKRAKKSRDGYEEEFCFRKK